MQVLNFNGRWRADPSATPDDIRDGVAHMAMFAPHDIADRCDKIMSTDYSKHPPPGTAAEIAVPFDPRQTSEGEAQRASAVKAIEALFAKIDRMGRDPANPRWYGGYFGLRFVGRFNGLLATTWDGDRCTIELPTVITPSYEGVLDELEDLLIQGFGGRPHWANRNTLYNSSTAATRIKTLYGNRAARWRAVRNRFDPTDRPATHPDPLFDNPYVAGMGLT
jgi:hypothetical protein